MSIINSFERRYPGHGEKIEESRRQVQEAQKSGDEAKIEEEQQRHHDLMRTIHHQVRDERIKQRMARRGSPVNVTIQNDIKR